MLPERMETGSCEDEKYIGKERAPVQFFSMCQGFFLQEKPFKKRSIYGESELYTMT